MDLYAIDSLSVTGRSWLHRAPVALKITGLVAVLALLLSATLVPVPAGVLAAMVVAALTARVPLRLFLALLLYPAAFLAVFLLSIKALTPAVALLLVLRVLAITATVVLFLVTTSYPALFAALGRVLPGFVLAALFYTYRSVFIIAHSLADLRIALHLRGGLSWRHPVASARNLGMALGHLLVHILESSHRMADSLRVRGFVDRIYSVRERP